MARWVVGMVLALVAALLGIPAAAAAVPATTAAVSHSYAGQHPTDLAKNTTSERGPPATPDQSDTDCDVDRLPQGAPARPEAATPAQFFSYAYDYPAPLVQVARAARVAPETDDDAWLGFVRSPRLHVAAKVSPGSVNKVGGTQNCVSCAIAGDSTLAGRPASAIKLDPDVPFPNGMAQIEGYAGSTWRWSTGQGAIEQELLAAGNGARGIVYGMRSNGTAHVFNAVVQRGQVNFVDFQTGGAGSFAGFSRYAFIRTN